MISLHVPHNSGQITKATRSAIDRTSGQQMRCRYSDHACTAVAARHCLTLATEDPVLMPPKCSCLKKHLLGCETLCCTSSPNDPHALPGVRGGSEEFAVLYHLLHSLLKEDNDQDHGPIPLPEKEQTPILRSLIPLVKDLVVKVWRLRAGA